MGAAGIEPASTPKRRGLPWPSFCPACRENRGGAAGTRFGLDGWVGLVGWTQDGHGRVIGLLLDVFWVIVGGTAGLATVRLTGMVLNARDRRRHKRCLRNIERLEIANGFREAPPTLRDILRNQRQTTFSPGQIFELKPGASQPILHPGPRPQASFGDLVAQQQAAYQLHSGHLAALLAKYGTAQADPRG